MGCAAALSDAFVLAKYKFQDETLPVFAATIMTSLNLFNICLLKLTGFLSSDGSVQEQPAEREVIRAQVPAVQSFGCKDDFGT